MIEDITFCQEKKCPKKEHCLRFRKSIKQLASYFAKSPYDIEKQECDYYISNKLDEKDVQS